jgi:hypothetical protein
MTTPEARADRLVEALHENTDALHSVKRRYRWTLALTALLALTLVYVLYSNHEANVETCESSNEIRADIDEKFGSIGGFLRTAINDTPENREFIIIVTTNLPARDCSDISWIN